MSKKSSCQKKQRAHKVSSGARARRKEANRLRQEQQHANRLAKEDERASEDPAYALHLAARRDGVRPVWTSDRIKQVIVAPVEDWKKKRRANALDLVTDKPAKRSKARPEQIGSLFEPLTK